MESKLSKAEDLNGSLQFELEKVRAEQHEQAGQQNNNYYEGEELQARFNDLTEKHQKLQGGIREQQLVTDEVRRQASSFMHDVEEMSELAQTNWEREEQLSDQVQRLESEVEHWKNRYAKARAQLRHLRSPSVGLADSLPNAGSFANSKEFIRKDGLVKDVHVTKFQISIDELLRTARSDEPDGVNQQIKTVVLAVRHIMQDVDASSEEHGGSSPMFIKTKGRVLATANNLITASKNFANSNGLSPVSLLDAAASHVSTSVVELVRLVKVRPTPANELEQDDDPSQIQSPGYFNVPSNQNSQSVHESIYSAISTPAVAAQGKVVSSHFPLPPKGVPNGQVSDTERIDFTQLESRDLQELKVCI